MDLSKNAFFKICVNRYHERNEPEWGKKIRNRDDTLSELEQVAAHGRKKTDVTDPCAINKHPQEM